ncbi:uncharacterized protein LOC144866340 [Branchiostoma floridae x Branchiostoma japonicum]
MQNKVLVFRSLNWYLSLICVFLSTVSRVYRGENEHQDHLCADVLIAMHRRPFERLTFVLDTGSPKNIISMDDFRKFGRNATNEHMQAIDLASGEMVLTGRTGRVSIVRGPLTFHLEFCIKTSGPQVPILGLDACLRMGLLAFDDKKRQGRARRVLHHNMGPDHLDPDYLRGRDPLLAEVVLSMRNYFTNFVAKNQRPQEHLDEDMDAFIDALENLERQWKNHVEAEEERRQREEEERQREAHERLIQQHQAVLERDARREEARRERMRERARYPFLEGGPPFIRKEGAGVQVQQDRRGPVPSEATAGAAANHHRRGADPRPVPRPRAPPEAAAGRPEVAPGTVVAPPAAIQDPPGAGPGLAPGPAVGAPVAQPAAIDHPPGAGPRQDQPEVAPGPAAEAPVVPPAERQRDAGAGPGAALAPPVEQRHQAGGDAGAAVAMAVDPGPGERPEQLLLGQPPGPEAVQAYATPLAKAESAATSAIPWHAVLRWQLSATEGGPRACPRGCVKVMGDARCWHSGGLPVGPPSPVWLRLLARLLTR